MTRSPDGFLVARGEAGALLPRMENRHGLVAGATGTGKTVAVRVLAEHSSSTIPRRRC